MRRQAAQLDQVAHPARADHELADVDRGEAAADALEHHVQPMPVGQHRVDERLAEVDAPAAGLEHPLDQLVHLRGTEHQVGELVPPAPGDEDPARVVDPDLLDLGIVEERLERPEARDPRDELTHHTIRVGHRDHGAGEAALVVAAHDVLGDAAHDTGVALRVDTVRAHPLAHLAVEHLDQLAVRVLVRHGHASPPSRVGFCATTYPRTGDSHTVEGKACGQPPGPSIRAPERGTSQHLCDGPR